MDVTYISFKSLCDRTRAGEHLKVMAVLGGIVKFEGTTQLNVDDQVCINVPVQGKILRYENVVLDWCIARYKYYIEG